MIRSMTGFGRASFELEGRTFELEARTVNSRYLDLRIKLPRPLSGYESDLKSLVQARLSRGKVDLSVSLAGAGSSPGKLEVDDSLVAEYVMAARRIGAEHGLAGALDADDLLSMPGVVRFVDPEVDPEALKAALAGGVGRLLDALDAMRCSEGEALAADFDQRLTRIEELVDYFEARSDTVLEAARERLRKRIDQIRQDVGSVDEARLHQEVVLAADKLDVSEELVRLRSHVEQFREIMAGGDEGQPVGRRLDFLLQEMSREANTVGSKANDAPLAHQVVELKAELERVREQVQNVE
jgi:uncharacterized protein (TIGR00255 family)